MALTLKGGRAMGKGPDDDTLLEQIVENLPNLVFVKDARDLRFVRFNRAAEEFLGYEREEIIGSTVHDVFPQHEADFFAALDRRVLAEGHPIDIEAEFVRTRRNGRRVLHTTKIPLYGSDGRPRYLLGVSEDITDRYEIERSRRENQTEQERADRELLELRRRLSGIIRQGAIAFDFQPIADLETMEPIGAEALARFDLEPLAPPQMWFARAGTAGLLVELEVAAIAGALASIDELPGEQFLAVNVSSETLVSDELTAALAESALDRVVFELTEHSRVSDYAQLERRITALRQRGARVAIDDTGAGWSSMQHVIMVGPDIIKLDIDLTRGIDSSLSRRALAAAIVAFAAEVGSMVVAEGIETEDELETLRGLGVAYGQGYHLCRPQRLPLPEGPVSER